MKLRNLIRGVVVVAGGLAMSVPASAFFFIIPIPNFAKPAPLDKLIDAYERSSETKAVAYVSEDKIFGSKQWAWGHYSGQVTQEEASRRAMAQCEAGLANAQRALAGGQPLYDFGKKSCELHEFTNKTVSLPPPAPPPPPIPPPPIVVTLPPVPTAGQLPAGSEPQAGSRASAGDLPPSAGTAAAATPPASAASTPAMAPSVPVEAAESPTAKRLRELSDLLKKGLVTEDEYKAKRKAILDSM